MKEVATIKFKDAETADEAVAVVRCSDTLVALCLSVKGGSDVEVVMGKADAAKLLEALRAATT